METTLDLQPREWPPLLAPPPRPRADLNVSLTLSPAPSQHPLQAGVSVYCLLLLVLLTCSGPLGGLLDT